jgi:hypothetical protein
MDYAVLIITAIVLFFYFFYVTGRAWQRRHTYVEEFWHSGGW